VQAKDHRIALGLPDVYAAYELLEFLHSLWSGIMLDKLLEIGMVTPIGLNVFAIKGVVGDRIG
tara:strand:- start:2119 stop:2307 length:189 start_codon:yes stop_codon:yes gene_type:complete